jgi:non-ribosomal peptide synthetase component F
MRLTRTLHHAAQRAPGRISTIYRHRARTVGETIPRVSRPAGALPALGVGEGDRVGILALNDNELPGGEAGEIVGEIVVRGGHVMTREPHGPGGTGGA